jgi:hypothetical protein
MNLIKVIPRIFHSPNIRTLILICACLITFAGCVRRTPLAVSPLVHTIQVPGETLGIISFWYTGSVSNWKGIAEYNGKLNPRKLQLGTRILIPDEILKTRRPLPRVFVIRAMKQQAREESLSRIGARKTGSATTEGAVTDGAAVFEPESEPTPELIPPDPALEVEPTPYQREEVPPTERDEFMEELLRTLLSENVAQTLP